MRPTQAVRLALGVMAAVAAIGAIDSGSGGAWDLFVLFGALLVMTVILLVGTTVRRPLIPVRADLYRWLAARAAVTGERTEHLADRAISSYRSGLVGDVDPDVDDGT